MHKLKKKKKETGNQLVKKEGERGWNKGSIGTKEWSDHLSYLE
jgi:hypothetical protein